MKVDLPTLKEHCQESKIHNALQLSRQMGVAPSTVYRVLNGTTTPGTEFIAGLRRAFPNCDLNKLLIP